ncbi:MAG: hypothetical protein A3G23_10410 [Bacteroidetes bacterium RIFCSPLOWO2_12_FULL_37_12]|nr:MAG: hypothetical protein A3G23_10410 [Bacteroidetes bacterium RIFCSPLOWO2_12_FULL_37_12]
MNTENTVKQQITEVFMIRPATFFPNPETLSDNSFQFHKKSKVNKAVLTKKAQLEFDNFVKLLRQSGITVHVHKDPNKPPLPDSIFPNNWFSTHQGGVVIIYPMKSPLRRKEKHPTLVTLIKEKYPLIYDWSDWEIRNQFLEGTGSLVLDRANKVVYSSVSTRTSEFLLEKWIKEFGYRSVLFKSVDKKGKPVFHTNIVLSVGTKFTIVCMSAIPEKKHRKELSEMFKSTNKEIIEISKDQMYAFCGNILELTNQAGEQLIIMSTHAWESFTKEQQDKLQTFGKILHSPLDTIETYGGGGARCMIAELV